MLSRSVSREALTMAPRSNKYCSVPQCSSRLNGTISLHLFPKDDKLKDDWARKLKIGKKVSKYMSVCSLHFMPEDYILPGIPTKRRSLKRNAKPSKNLPVRKCDKKVSTPEKRRQQEREQRVRKRMREECFHENSDMSAECGPSEEEEQVNEQENRALAASVLLDLHKQLNEIVSEPKNADKGVQFDENMFNVKTYQTVLGLIRNNKELYTMTGIPSFDTLTALSECTLKLENDNSSFILPIKERIVLTMIRLKLDISFRALAILFQITPQTCKNYFHHTLKLLAQVLKSMIKWPSKEEILANMPKCFANYRTTRVVLDCSEIYIQKSKCLKCRILTYSHYKGHNTAKFLLGVAPSGLITYVSPCYGGRASDKAIFNESGLLTKLMPLEDSVMVDKGFLIEDECAYQGIRIIQPPFLKKQVQFTKSDALNTASIAKARVHVERSIQRMKLFKIISNQTPSYLVSALDDIIVVIAGLVNLSPPILSDNKF